MPTDDDAPNVVRLNGRRKRASGVVPKQPSGWKSRLTTNQNGEPKGTLPNATLIFQHDPEWSGVLGYDERAEEPVFLKPPPFFDCPPSLLAAPRSLVDSDDVRACQWLEERYGIVLPLAQIHAAINAVAATRPFNRVREYLEGLEPWDGVTRLDQWLSCLLGADDNPYTRAVGAKWMISAVAREFRPGCKCDHVLVLEGPQGIGKSTALRVLAGDENFGDDVPALGSKDAQQYLGGLWIVELGEMDAASKADQSTLKRFLTTTEDRYRPSYGRRTIKHARRCVFAGSVNLQEYLKDHTGGRRFWPVECRNIDVNTLKAARDQLWAEALHRFRAGETWHLCEELEELARVEQATRLEADPWEDAVRNYTTTRLRGSFVTTAELLEYAVGIETAHMTKADKNRVGGIMRRLEWRYGEDATQNRARGWFRP